eukprot:TRINITY_DN6342_c0_g1_i3.p6 TRINITY_DN6342_c0_g1~~TRINITY_DN6342_c0_g1_i3.p6  ORF type:complete len:106 (-),score=15.81 TRINITY_DN6342_c0_g1_i3:3784-4101(-)
MKMLPVMLSIVIFWPPTLGPKAEKPKWVCGMVSMHMVSSIEMCSTALVSHYDLPGSSGFMGAACMVADEDEYTTKQTFYLLCERSGMHFYESLNMVDCYERKTSG